MSAGFYLDRESFIGRLHPVTRILLLFLAFTTALVAQHPLAILPLWAIYGSVGMAAGALPGLKRVGWVLFLVALSSFIIWTFAYGGADHLFQFGPLRATRQGMIFGAGMGLRLTLMMFCGLVFLTATPVEDFSYGLTRLGLPFAVSFALSLSFRLAPLFLDTMRDILDAQRARGLRTGGGIVGRLRVYVPLLVPVFATALRRADQLALALESKGFGLTNRRGSLREYRAGGKDALALILVSLLLLALIALRILGYGAVTRW